MQKTLPAYFRSQRQIIIDSEALLAERAALDEAKFLARADAIGVDQKILRLRYGQFLGEESEGHGGGHGDAGETAQATTMPTTRSTPKRPRRPASATPATRSPNTATCTTSPRRRRCSIRTPGRS